VDFATLVIGPIPGGLAIVSLCVAVFWGAVSGSGVATVAALGAVLIPAMIDAGYPKGFAASVIAAAGGLSILIPPSVPFILFGTLANVSVGGLFLAGVLPGLTFAGLFLIYIVLFCWKRNLKGVGRFGTPKEIWKAVKNAFWGLMTPVIILGGIYSGIFTPTEAAIISVWYAIIIGLFVYRSFSFRSLPRIFCSAGISSASILLIMSNASMFAWAMTGQGVASAFSKLILSFSNDANIILALVMLVVIIAGFFLDGNSIMYICVPLFLPITIALKQSNMWLGVVMSAGIVVGLITPPVAANIYPAAKIAGINLVTIAKSIIWFVLLGIVGCYLVLFFPEISLFLPRLLGFNVG
jgi:C4-dicarboxylate transporter DctM subunit